MARAPVALGDSPLHVVWQASIAAAATMRDWGGEYIVFNPGSGDTHFLDIVSGEVLAALAAAPQPATALCARVARLLEVDNDEHVAGNVGAILAHLDELGLIEPLRAC